MNASLGHILWKWDLDPQQEMPIEIPDSNRVILADLFSELNYRRGAEIGTARGKFATVLIAHNPKCELYCIDSWTIYDGIHDFKDAGKMSELKIMAHSRLNPHTNIHIINKFSMDAVKDFEDESLDFVYIDANHEWPYVTQDIFYWAKKVKPGGIVSGHDYLKKPRKDGLVQVKEAVKGYTEAFNISPWFVLDKGRAGSWFWVKQ